MNKDGPWGTTAVQAMISGKRKLGIGVKSENGKSRGINLKVTLQEAIRNDKFLAQYSVATLFQHCNAVSR